MEFNTTKKWNCQELVYNILEDLFMYTGKLMDGKTLFILAQNTRYNNAQPYLLASTLTRAYRRMRKIIEFRIIQHELAVKKLHEDNILAIAKAEAEWSKFHDDAIITMIAIILAIATLIVCWVVLYNIFTYV